MRIEDCDQYTLICYTNHTKKKFPGKEKYIDLKTSVLNRKGILYFSYFDHGKKRNIILIKKIISYSLL